MKKRCLFLLVLMLLILLMPAVMAESSVTPPPPGAHYRTLKNGSAGYDVYLLKMRMYQLGYFTTNKASEEYNGTMVKHIKELQELNGLEQTGIATPELQVLIFSDACIPAAVTPAPTTAPTPPPAPQMAVYEPELPLLDDEGFLPQGSGEEFVYQDADEGLWYYFSDTLSVEIRRYTQGGKYKLQWFETHVKLRGITPENYASFKTKKVTGGAFVSPVDIAKNNHVVLGITDDAYTKRTYSNKKAGLVIRNGVLLENTPYTNRNTARFPSLEVMAFLPDGTMALYENGETTPEYLLSLGVKNSYAFGPILVKNGKESLAVRNMGEFSKAKEPRCAIGLVEPNHYMILTVVGRTSYSDGCTLAWLAEKMQEKGIENAFNLDGGGTTALVFMGKVLNRKNESSLRDVTNIIGFGTSPTVQ